MMLHNSSESTRDWIKWWIKIRFQIEPCPQESKLNHEIMRWDPAPNRWVVILLGSLLKYNDGFRALEYCTGPFDLIVSNQRIWLWGRMIGANQSVISQAISSNAPFPKGDPQWPFWEGERIGKKGSRRQQRCSITALIWLLFTFYVFSFSLFHTEMWLAV